MQTITLNIKTPSAYSRLLELLQPLQDVEIADTKVVAEEQSAYKKSEKTKPLFDFASYCGRLTAPSDIAETENQLKAMRSEWDRNF